MVAGVRGETAQSIRIERSAEERGGAGDQRDRRRFPQFAVGFAVRAADDAFDRAVAVDALKSQHRRIHGGQVPALVADEDRPSRRHRVEVAFVETLAGKEDRVEPPGDEELTVAEAGVGVPQTVEHLVDVRAAGPDSALGIFARVGADIGVLPHSAAAGMCVGLDHSGEDHGIGVTVVDAGGTVGLELVEGTDGSDPRSADHDRLGGGSCGIKCPYGTGWVDDLFGRVHRLSASFLRQCRRRRAAVRLCRA